MPTDNRVCCKQIVNPAGNISFIRKSKITSADNYLKKLEYSDFITIFVDTGRICDILFK